MNNPVRNTATSGIIMAVGGTTAGGGYLSVPASKRSSVVKRPRGQRITDDIESAVYAHIQAIRALGRTKTDTSEIAIALGLAQSVVEKTISSLTQKGVRVING